LSVTPAHRKDTAFLGWRGSVTTIHAKLFSDKFWNYVSNGQSLIGATINSSFDTGSFEILDQAMPSLSGDTSIILKNK